MLSLLIVKKLAFIIAILLSGALMCRAALVRNPVSWTLSAEHKADSLFTVSATGSISANGWHIYDLVERRGGPNPTTFVLSGEGFETVGEPAVESEVQLSFDPVFGMEIGVCEAPVVISQDVRLLSGGGVVRADLEWQACREGECLPPQEWSGTVQIGQAPDSVNPAVPARGRGLWGLILEAIAWGFVALLTPCVFPMIPMTVSYFLKQEGRSGRRLALVFGLSIVLLYTLPIALIILVSLLTGGQSVTADIFNWLATHWLPNILFFIIFMIFAASFLGAFEIRLPSRLVNSSDAKADKGGIAGAFFIALTLVLVSFSCTGPIVGSVLIKSAQGQFWEPILTMLAFSLAFALPFTLFAWAPSLMRKLPRSGSWLGGVKVTLGFLELALGLKFLSVADQTYHWGILDRHVYLALWIVIFTLLGLYLLGKLRLKGDSEPGPIGVGRLALAIADLAFVVYMIPGMWGAPLKALSGYLPPITTQDFVLDKYVPAVRPAASSPERKYSDFLALPYGLEAHFDFDEAIAAARAEGKPVLLDFTGHGCVNCREMEARVWSDPRVLHLLRERFVICSLYCDDKTVVDEADWVTTDSGKLLRGLGKINSWFMQSRFGVNAQPYYAILDPWTEQLKLPARGYDLDVEEYLAFLESGLK